MQAKDFVYLMEKLFAANKRDELTLEEFATIYSAACEVVFSRPGTEPKENPNIEYLVSAAKKHAGGQLVGTDHAYLLDSTPQALGSKPDTAAIATHFLRHRTEIAASHIDKNERFNTYIGKGMPVEIPASRPGLRVKKPLVSKP